MDKTPTPHKKTKCKYFGNFSRGHLFYGYFRLHNSPFFCTFVKEKNERNAIFENLKTVYFKNPTVRSGEYSSHSEATTQPGAKMSL